MIIDGYPGRAASSMLQDFAQKRNGDYRVVFGAETRSLSPYASWSGVPASSLGYDLENAQTVVSFGAPLLDGWGQSRTLHSPLGRAGRRHGRIRNCD